MQVIYVSNCCSSAANKKIHELIKGYSSNAAQKFHSLIVNGIAENGGIDVNAVSFTPINNKFTKLKKFILDDDKENGVNFYYLRTVNIKLLNNIYDYIQLKKKLKDLLKENGDCVVIYDILRLTCVKAVLSFCKKNKIKSYGIVTDVPGKRAFKGSILRRLLDSVLFSDIKKCNGYIFMTKQMNDYINKTGKPWCLIECVCDKNIDVSDIPKDSEKKICMYAGSLNKVYGIEHLIEGFIKSSMDDAVLKIFGTGDYVEEVKKIASENENIEYCGLVSNDIILLEEKKADLLVNPRPNIGEYTKYSFPSKTLEYMASGTPMVGFKLDGIPDEYFDYIYTFSEYTVDGFAQSFKTILSQDKKELEKFGKEAQKFVLENKNNVVLSKRIIDLIINNQ